MSCPKCGMRYENLFSCPACGTPAPNSQYQNYYGQTQYAQQQYTQQQYTQQQYTQQQPNQQGEQAYQQTQQAAYQQPYPAFNTQKSKAIAAVLAWFLGNLGIHNFYLGYKKRGIAQLLLSLIPCVFIIVGFCLIVSASLSTATEIIYDGGMELAKEVMFAYLLIIIGTIPLSIVGVWRLVEFIMILVGSLKDAKGIPLA